MRDEPAIRPPKTDPGLDSRRPVSSPRKSQRARLRAAGRGRQGWLLVLSLAATVAILSSPLLYARRWSGRIYPGVAVSGVDIGGMTIADAEAHLVAAGLDPAAPVIVQLGTEGDRTALDGDAIRLDLSATLDEAFAVSRRGTRARRALEMIAVRFDRRDIEPRIDLDGALARSALEILADGHDRPVRDADVALVGTEVVATEPQTGRRLDLDGSMAELERRAERSQWPVRDVVLPVQSVHPEVDNLGSALDTAKWLLEGPIEVRAFDESWELAPDAIAPLLKPAVADGTVVLDIDTAGLAVLLNPVTEAVSRTAEIARFHFDDEAGELQVAQSGVTGRRVSIERTARRLVDLPRDGPRRLQVAIDFVEPEISDSVTAAELGISELLWEETSYYRGSSPDRVHNIRIAAERFDGALIPPNSDFSFNAQIGDITEETGYRKTLIILDGATADGVGGGVCQVSTTLFRIAFWSGLPIRQRTAHGYRVAYYEQGAPMGLDATVYRPVLDFVFGNDTASWMLLETVTDVADMSLTFRLYGAPTGRTVKMEGPFISGETAPSPPRTEVDANLAPGATRTLELARSGASVKVTRIIDVDGDELREDFYSQYRPTGAVTAVGPAPDLPPYPEPEEGVDAAEPVVQAPPGADVAGTP